MNSIRIIFEKFSNKMIHCSSCDADVLFELIEEIECDWGTHSVIQCPNCQELFSIDKQCRAFQDLMNLLEYDESLFSEIEKSQYLKDPHC